MCVWPSEGLCVSGEKPEDNHFTPTISGFQTVNNSGRIEQLLIFSQRPFFPQTIENVETFLSKGSPTFGDLREHLLMFDSSLKTEMLRYKTILQVMILIIIVVHFI